MKIATIKIKEVHTDSEYIAVSDIINKENDPNSINLISNTEVIKSDAFHKQSILTSYNSEELVKPTLLLTEESLSSYDTPLEKFEVREAQQLKNTSNLFIPVKFSRFLSTLDDELGSQVCTAELDEAFIKDQLQLSCVFKKYLFEKLINIDKYK